MLSVEWPGAHSTFNIEHSTLGFMNYLIANWKMNLPPEGIDAYMRALRATDAADTPIVVAPPFPYIRDIHNEESLFVGAQNCGDQKSGAFTGEVCASMLKDAGSHCCSNRRGKQRGCRSGGRTKCA